MGKISIKHEISSKILKKCILQKCSYVKYHQFKLNYRFIIIKFNFSSNTLPKIFIRLQIMGSLEDEKQNSENQGMTQGAPVNKCITIHQNGDNYSGTFLCSPEAYPSTRYRYGEYVKLYDNLYFRVK